MDGRTTTTAAALIFSRDTANEFELELPHNGEGLTDVVL
jgi:hypothetical protein